MGTINWDRVAELRSPLLILMAIAAVAIGVFQIPIVGVIAGWIWIGVGLAFVAWATDGSAQARGRT